MSKGDSVSRKSTLARPKAKKKKGKPEKLLDVAHACSVLAVDGADCSGWSMWDRGVLQRYGECDIFEGEPAKIIDQFLQLTPAPHVVVIERPFMMRFGGQSALGTGRKVWSVAAKRAGLERRTVSVYPSQWRSPILPKGFASAKREVVRPEEQKCAGEVVRGALGLLYEQQHPIGVEAAPAILIGKWGSFAPAVLRVLPKPKPEKTYPVTVVKFGRFAMRAKPKKRIHKATDGAQHMVGMWLVVDGVVAEKTDRLTQAQLDTAEVRLVYANLDPKSPHYMGDREQLSTCPHHTHVSLHAASDQILAGWSYVADLVERDYLAHAVACDAELPIELVKGFTDALHGALQAMPKPKRKRKAAHAA